MQFDIYVEIISVENNINIITKKPFYRVVLTDSSMGKVHPFLAKFTDYMQAEKYCSELGTVLARFGGQYRSQSLDFKQN